MTNRELDYTALNTAMAALAELRELGEAVRDLSRRVAAVELEMTGRRELAEDADEAAAAASGAWAHITPR
jgi:hypothetical protein